MKNKPILLYVEDDEETIQDIVFLLKDSFRKIYTAKDGEEALLMFSKNNPDVVILDINIPKINGIEVAKKIRKSNADVPILFLTAYSDKDKLIDAINIGASSYLVKPFNIDELHLAIAKTMSSIGEGCKIKLANDFVWDTQTNIISFKSNSLKLTKKEIQLMSVLNENRQQFFTACDISAELFTTATKDTVCNNSVQLLSRFKKKVIKNFEVQEFFIQNIYGVGYKLL